MDLYLIIMESTTPFNETSKAILKKWLVAARTTEQPEKNAIDYPEAILQEFKLQNAIATEQLAQLYKLNAKTDNVIKIAYIIIGIGIACLIYFMAYK